MNFYQPNLVLIRTENDDFYLHATTFSDKFHYRVNSAQVAPIINEAGILEVKLFVLDDPGLYPKNYLVEGAPESLSFNMVNSLVHLVNLGSFPEDTLGDDDLLTFGIEAEVVFQHPNSPLTRNGGKSTVRTLSAGGRGRPGSSKI